MAAQKSTLLPTDNNNSNEASENSLRRFTIVFFGAANTGKTSLILRFLGYGFNQDYTPTIENFFIKHVFYNNQTYELQIIDTSGTYEFPAMRKVDIIKADAFVLVYSSDDPESFARLGRYRSEMLEERKERHPCLVVCNKRDLPWDTHQGIFTDHRGLQISVQHLVESEWQCMWIECSAKENQQIEDIFLKLMDELGRGKHKERRKISSLLTMNKKRPNSKVSFNTIQIDSAVMKHV